MTEHERKGGETADGSTDVPSPTEEGDDDFAFPKQEAEQRALEQIFQLLLNTRRVDFSHYRQSTVLRRMVRRMGFSRHSTFKSYLKFIESTPVELHRLHDDLLLSFTEFFRDPAAFEVLKKKVFPRLFRETSRKSAVRIWVPGCSTGEEVYSLAICLFEYFEEHRLPFHATLFGTDLAERHIVTARTALYSDKILRQISEERLARFFDTTPEGYRVIKQIREMCIFAAQDVTQDPPLPKIDMVSCRNVLIYFDTAFQEAAIPLFHFSLKPTGVLWLGSSESLGRFTNLFTPMDKRHNFFTKAASGERPTYRFPSGVAAHRLGRPSKNGTGAHRLSRTRDIKEIVDSYILTHCSPAGVLVDGAMQIRRFFGNTAPYVGPSHGEASLKLSSMAKEGLMPDLYVLIEEAKKQRTEVRKKRVVFTLENEAFNVDICVVPFLLSADDGQYFLIMFESVPSNPVLSLSSEVDPSEHDELFELRRELQSTKDHLQSIIEEKDTVNQDLWAANEEVQSTNEELQSVNEELEAAKEELESGNEELLALNEELSVKNTALVESEDRFRHLLESARDIYFRYNVKEERFDYISSAVESVLGYRPEEFARNWREIEISSRGEDSPGIRRRVGAVSAATSGRLDLPPWEGRYRHKDGRTVWLAMSGRVLLDDAGVPAVATETARDITDRKNAEIALQLSESRFKGVFDNTGSGVVVYRAVNDGEDFEIVDFNRAAERMEAISRDEVVGRKLRDVFPGVAEFGLFEVFQRVCSTGEAERHPISQYVDDRIRGWRENYVFRLSSDEIVAVYEDLTSQKQAEEALRESEARWHFAVDGNGLGLWDWNLVTDEVFFSNQWKRMLGYRQDEIENRFDEWNTRVHPEDLARVIEDIRRHVDGETTIYLNEHRLRCKDGSYKWILDRGKIVSRGADGKPLRMIGTLTDVTERRYMEEQLRQSEKMQAVGQLAGGIAHDFNNQLAAILGYAELLREEVSGESERTGFADRIILGIQRASDLTAQLLAFARKGKYLSVPVDMHRIVFEVVSLLQHSIDKRIEIQQLLKAAPATTLGDPTQLQNAMLNLALNARDAMPEGGELIFTTDTVELDGAPIAATSEELRPGRYLQISVIDSGAGIDTETLPKIFEPFFTTKPPGQGTGMGLAAVYGTARTHRGAVTVSSKPGEGSTFKLFLPLWEQEEQVFGENADAPESVPSGNAHILLVDDELAVCEVASQMLERLGYEVSVCRNGKEALSFFREKADSVDLVILDVVMPIMGGKDTFVALREISPDIPVLLSSGYSVDGEPQRILEMGAAGFLQKPFRKAVLSSTVADILRQHEFGKRKRK